MKLRTFALTAVTTLLALHLGVTQADEQKRYSVSATYKEECGSCHVPYPPQLLPADSWRSLMGGLDKHFGSNATLEWPVAKEITQFLVTNAGRSGQSPSAGAKGPTLRITETAWFKREHRDGHDGLSASVWQSAAVKSPANCVACHREAGEGNYSERGIHIPRAK